MSKDQTLSLVAKVVDQYSGPLANMKKALDAMTEREGKGHRDGARATIKHHEQQLKLNKAFRETGDALKQVINPQLVEMGLNFTKLAGPIAAVGAGFAAAIKGGLDLSTSARAWGDMVDKTGLSLRNIRELSLLAGRLNSTPDRMLSGFASLNALLDQYRQNKGDLVNWSSHINPTNDLNKFFANLKVSPNNDAAWDLIQQQLKKTPNETEREKLLNQFQMDPSLALSRMQSEKAQVDANLGDVSPKTMKAAQDVADAIDSTKEAFGRLSTDLGKMVLPELDAFAKGLKSFADWLDKPSQGWQALKDFFSGATTLTPGTGTRGRNASNPLPDYSGQMNDFSDWLHKNAQPSDSQYGGKNPLYHRDSFDGSGFDPSLVHKADFTTDSFSSYSRAEQSIQKSVFLGTMQGVLEAFQRWRDQATGSSGGFSQASYEGGGVGGSGGGGMGGAGGGGGSGSGGPDPSAGKPYATPKGPRGQRAMDIMQRLIQKWHWSKAGAAIAAANADSESSFNPSANGDGGMSHGLWQWNRGRFAALQKFAAAQGKSWRDANAQIDFFAQEAQRKVRGMAHAHDLSHAGAMSYAFEGYRNRAEDFARARKAYGYLNKYEKQDHSVIDTARAAGVGHLTHKIDGHAKITIDHRNAPKGTKTSTQVSGNIFKKVHVNKGKLGTMAAEGGVEI